MRLYIHLLLALCLLISPAAAAEKIYDAVIKGGRVIDPETGLDVVRNVGLFGRKIAKISTDDLTGKTVLDATDLVVSPGFIDLHAHRQNLVTQTYQIHDRVTTALDLEAGLFPLQDHLKSRRGKSLIHYGYSSGHAYVRSLVKQGDLTRAYHEVPTDSELKAILKGVEEGLDEGGIGIGLLMDYFSLGVNEAELEGLFKLAAKRGVTIFSHIRMPDDMLDPSGYKEMMDQARKEGVDVTTELYPYTAGSTEINSGIFDHDWQKKFGITYDDLEWPPTGERFTDKAMWDQHRKDYPKGVVILHAMTEEWVKQAMTYPGVIIASDGMAMERSDQRAHPRGMGTYARVVGKYVRDDIVLILPDAINRMTYLLARRLEKFTPIMKNKGRLQEGRDADITIFDPETVIDQATFANPNQFSKGITHVIVAGKIVVKREEIQKDTFPGEPITTK